MFIQNGGNYMGERRDVARSKLLIRQAYFTLLFRKEQRKITVNDILEEADISRGTFYSHFKDIPDLEEQLEDTILYACKKTLEQKPIEELIKNPYAQVEMFVNIFAVHRNEIRALAKHHKDSHLSIKFKNLIKQGLVGNKYFLDDPDESVLLNSCIASTLVDACIDWIVSESPIDKKAFVRTISDFLAGGIINLQNH